MFLSSSLVEALYRNFNRPNIDLLINDDTESIAELIPYTKNIIKFSYQKKKQNRLLQEKNIIFKIFNKYDLSISLTASDRSVFYGLISGKKSISAVEFDLKKSWWKKLFLSHYYFFDNSKHILLNNLEPLQILKISYKKIHQPIEPSNESMKIIKDKIDLYNIKDFFIFHPSAQYDYKIYPAKLRHNLLTNLTNLGISIVVTGGSNTYDLEIKKHLPVLKNIIDFIGETSIEEFIALSKLSIGYIGMDTLNMHIAASQNKKVFAIYGPTNLRMWSPWCNFLQQATIENTPNQTYGNITIFQANMKCVACGKAGCNNSGKSDCLSEIDPNQVFEEIKIWLKEKFY